MSNAMYDLLFRADTKELDQASESLKKVGKDTNQAANDAEKAKPSIAALAGEYLGLRKSTDEVSSGLQDVAKSFNPVNLAVGLMAATVGALSLGALKQMVSGVIESAVELNGLSKQTGMTVEQLSIMQQVAEGSGTSMDTISGAVIKFQKAIGESANLTSLQSKAFKELGINTADTSKTTEQYMSMAAQKLDGMEDGWQKNQILMALFGKTGTEVNEFLSDYANKGEVAALVTKEQAEQAEIYERNLIKLNQTVGVYKTMLGMGLLPVMSGIVQKITEQITGSANLDGAQRKLMTNGITEWGFSLAKGIAVGIEAFGILFNVVKGMAMAIGTLVGTVGTLGSAFGSLFSGDFSGALSKVQGMWSALKDGMAEAWQTATTSGLKFYGAVDQAHKDWLKTKDDVAPSSPDAPKPTPGNIAKAQVTPKAEKQTDTDKASEALQKYIDKQLVSLKADEQRTELSRTLAAIETAQFNKANDSLKQLAISQARLIDTKHQEEKVNKALDASRTNVEKQISDMQREIRQRSMTREEIRRENAELQVNLEINRQLADLNPTIIGYEEQRARLEAQRAEALRKINEQMRAEKEASKDGFQGMVDGIKDYKDSVTSVYEDMKQASKGALDSMTQGIADMVVTGKGSMKDLLASVLADFAKIMAQRALVAAATAAMSALGFANGGAFSGGVQMFADGGVVASPTAFAMSGGKMGIMGEAGPEAIMPLTRGADGKLGVKSSGGGGTSQIVQVSPQITVNVQSVDSEERAQQLAKHIGDIARGVTYGTIQDLMRPGNALGSVKR